MWLFSRLSHDGEKSILRIKRNFAHKAAGSKAWIFKKKKNRHTHKTLTLAVGFVCIRLKQRNETCKEVKISVAIIAVVLIFRLYSFMYPAGSFGALT